VFLNKKNLLLRKRFKTFHSISINQIDDFFGLRGKHPCPTKKTVIQDAVISTALKEPCPIEGKPLGVNGLKPNVSL
jgi:hypothetical protein